MTLQPITPSDEDVVDISRRKAMDEAGNNVFSSAAFTSNKDWNIGSGYFAEARPYRLHDLGVAKDYVVRGNLAQRLRQRIYGKCGHKSECPAAEAVHPHALKVHPKHQTEEEGWALCLFDLKRSTYEWLGGIIAHKR